MNSITENVSIYKVKRGRPYLFFNDADEKREWMKLNPDVRTDRSVVNRLDFCRALSVVGDGPEFTWLADIKADRFKHTILAELGRVEDDQELRDLARHLCEMQLSTSESVSFIRECRGVSKQASSERLEGVLRSRIDRWLDDGNGTPEEAVDVLRKLLAEVEGC